MSGSGQIRTYTRSECVVFLKTDEPFGGLSNMAGGYPVRVNGIRILTSEALYQACRFPHLPEVQAEIIAQRSPMTAKMKSKPHRRDSRPDWDQVRVKIMRWCLRVKLAQNWGAFSRILQETSDRPIVEQSRKDTFWGAKPVDDRTLIGMNVLGRLLMELRELAQSEDRKSLLSVQPLDIPDFRLAGRPIGHVTPPSAGPPVEIAAYPDATSNASACQTTRVQGSLFDRPVGHEAPDSCTADSRIARLKPYPAMKDSGAEWLGQVPESWEVRRNGRLFIQRNETGFAELPILEVSLRTGVRVRNFEASDRKQAMSDRGKYKRAVAGDIVYNTMRMWQGAVGVAPTDGLISPAYVIARPLPGSNSRYFESLFRTPAYMQEVDNYSRGIVKDRNRLYWEDFKAMPTCYPPPAEQAAIVRYLDHVDRRVRRLVRAKRKLIALLTEQKQAIIHRAVTRGLDPNVPLKDSGIEWLGQVPAHWQIRQLRRLVARGKKITYGIVQPGEPDSGGRFMVRGQDYSFGWVVPERIFRVSNAIESPYKRSRLAHGDLVLTIVGAGVGNVALVPKWLDGANITQTTARVSPDPEKVHGGFLHCVLGGPVGRRNVELYVKGAAQPGLNLEHLRMFLVPIPPTDEQLAIESFVVTSTSPIDKACIRAQREVDLLTEYHTRLISDVVTGKLDVREAAAALPEIDPLAEEDEAEDLDGATEAETDDLHSTLEEVEA